MKLYLTHSIEEPRDWWHIWLFTGYHHRDKNIMMGKIIASWEPSNISHYGDIYAGANGRIIEL